MMKRRIALVSGGSRGIGAACVRRLAAEGYAVIFLCRQRTDVAQGLTDELRSQGLDVDFRCCDVADSEQVQRTVDELLRIHKRIDVLVSNAGVAHLGLFTDMTDAEWNRLFDVNVKGMFHLCRAVLPGMISRREGSIVSISSMWGEVGASCEVAYSATKAAIIGMTKALAKEVGPSGVRVNCITPGVIDTDMNAALDDQARADLAEETPLGRIGTPDEVARAVSFLAGENASFITGQVLGVSGGLVI